MYMTVNSMNRRKEFRLSNTKVIEFIQLSGENIIIASGTIRYDASTTIAWCSPIRLSLRKYCSPVITNCMISDYNYDYTYSVKTTKCRLVSGVTHKLEKL